MSLMMINYYTLVAFILGYWIGEYRQYKNSMNAMKKYIDVYETMNKNK